jgi:hypothetical protein
MNKRIIIIALFSVLSACSSIKPIIRGEKSSGNESSNVDRVDLNLKDKNSKNNEVSPPEETVRVGDRGGDVFTGNSSVLPEVKPSLKKIKIALNLGPGIYRSINYVSVLKQLERKGLAPDIVTGTGMGAIVAAMYATGMTPEVIEWNFFKYFKEKRNNKPYDKDWVSEIDDAFLWKFKNTNVQDTKKRFFITLYDHNTQKTYYFDKGNIRNLLLLNLKLATYVNESTGSQKYSAAFEKEVFNARLLRQLGADLTIAADALGTSIEFENSNEFLFGVFTKIATRIQKEKKDFDLTLSLPIHHGLDSTKDSPLYIQKTQEYMTKQSPLILKKVQEKLDAVNNAGNE